MTRTLINGLESNTVLASDRGLSYGDGVFETLAVVDGRPRLLAYHQNRLRNGLSRLGIPLKDMSELWLEVEDLASKQEKAVIKVVVTRGVGERGYRSPKNPEPTRIVQLNSWPQYPDRFYTRGIEMRLCRYRLGHAPELAGLKHLNRLEQVMARSEWSDPNVPEGIMLDVDGRVISGTMSNIFIASDNTLVTPLLSRCGVNGVMRQAVMDKGKILGFGVSEEHLLLDDLKAADEVFVCNSLVGIWPVKSFQDRHWTEHRVAQGLTVELGLVW